MTSATPVSGELPDSGRLKGRVALVTGASRGIGRAVALRFAQEGAEVLCLARTQGALEELDDEIRGFGGTCILVPQDLTKFDELDAMAGGIAQRWGRLDILVGNAGVLGGLSPVGHFTPKLWQSAFDVNVTANYRLIRALDPLLRQSAAGRALFVTSGVTRGVFPYWGAYAASKAALESLVLTYAGEITKTRVKANLIDPGVVRSRLRTEAFPGENPDSLPDPASVTEIFVRLAQAESLENGAILTSL